MFSEKIETKMEEVSSYLYMTKNSTSVENSENNCELQWTELQTKSKSVIFGSFYRPPNANINSLLDLKYSATNASKNGREKPLFLAGDYNLPHIDWENSTIKPGGQSAIVKNFKKLWNGTGTNEHYS